MLEDTTGHLDRQRAPHVIRTATGTRDNVRGVKNRAVTAGGALTQQLDASEIIELLLASIAGGVTPIASATIANPTTALTATPSASGGVLPSGTYLYEYTAVGPGGSETAASSPSTGGVVTGPTGSVALTGVLVGAAGTLQRRIYRNFAGGAYGLIGVINDNVTTTYSDLGATTTAQAIINGPPPPVNQTGAGAQVWTFKPSATLDSQTWEWFDGYNAWNESGVYFDTLKLTWNATASGDSTVAVTLFGKDRNIMGGGITPALPTRVPIWIEGWEAQVWIDNLGTAPGTTLFGKAIMGEITIANKLGRKYFATNSQATAFVTFGELDVTGSLTIEADASSLAEYTAWDTSVARMFRLRTGNNGSVLGSSLLKPSILWDLPCFHTAYDLSGQDAGTQVAKLALNGSYSPTDAFTLSVTCVNSRTVAYS